MLSLCLHTAKCTQIETDPIKEAEKSTKSDVPVTVNATNTLQKPEIESDRETTSKGCVEM